MTPAERTRLEIEEGRRQVMINRRKEAVNLLKNSGFTGDVRALTEVEIDAHLALAQYFGAETSSGKLRKCVVCGEDHREGQRCLKIGRGVVPQNGRV